MKKIVNIIGSFVVTCVLFAIPICLTLLFTSGNAAEHGLIGLILVVALLSEFAIVVTLIYDKVDSDGA